MSQEIIRIETLNTDVINVATTEVVKIEGVGLQGEKGDTVSALWGTIVGNIDDQTDLKNQQDAQDSAIQSNTDEIGTLSAGNYILGDNIGQDLGLLDDQVKINTDAIGLLPATYVTSFKSRGGDVIPILDDYQASLITNDSTETGATVKDALDALDIEQGTQNTDIATNAGDIVTINNEQIVQNDAITAIEDTAVFESPVSPFPINYIWLGNQFQYDLIGLNGNPYEDDTIYNVNNNLKSPLYFYTKDVSPVTPTLTGVTPDSQSAGSNEGVILSNGSPSYSYSDPSAEHLVEFDNFDPLDVTQIVFISEGVSSISNLSDLENLSLLRLENGSLSSVDGYQNLTSLSYINFKLNDLVGNIDLSKLSNLITIQLQNNLIDSINLGSNAPFSLFDASTNALTQASVDNIINETDANGVSNGTLNVSGGTNSGFSSDSSASVVSLTDKSWTITSNGAVPRETGALWFKTQNVATITPTINGDPLNVLSSEGQFDPLTNAPNITWTNSTVENLVEYADFDPTQIFQLAFDNDGLTHLEGLLSLPNLNYITLYNSGCSSVDGFAPLPLLTQIQASGCNFTTIASLVGNVLCSTISFQGSSLDQTTVDMIFNDTDSNGVSNGTLNVSGGTNSAPSGASLTARTNLIGRGWTLTFN